MRCARRGSSGPALANGLAGDGLPPVIRLDLHRRPWPPGAPAAVERGGLRPVRVLVLAAEAEEVAIVRSLLARAERVPFEVGQATDPKAALTALARGQHDVCLCEQRQPTGDGLDLAREAARRGIAAPVLLVSALGLPDLDVDAIDAGAADFLDKEQFEVEGLERAIRLALARARRQATAPPRDAARALFADRLRCALARARRHGSLGAVIHLAVDRLGSLERRRGVEGADAVLDDLAEYLSIGQREPDTLLRLERNLFGVVLEELHRPEHAVLAARRLAATVADFSPDELGLTASTGLALITDAAVDAPSLDAMAARELVRAQAEGVGRCCQHDRGTGGEAGAALALADELGQAILADALSLDFQPQVTLCSPDLALAAVARWRHPSAGLIEGDRLLELAEAGSHLEALDDWAIAAACRQVRAWHEAGPAPAHIAVPLLEGRRLRRPDLARRLGACLEEAGLAAHRLELELDERLLADDLDAGGAMLREVSRLGVRLAVRAFGAGPTSLAVLRDAPLSTVKLARGLLRGAPEDVAVACFGIGVIRFARGLGRRLVAEEVDGQGQLQLLRAHGCDAVQAYASCPPLPPDACRDWLRQAAARS